MTEEEKYRFDLKGYLAVPKALTKAQLSALNRLLDEKIEQAGVPRNGAHRFGGLLDWGKPYRNLLANPRILPRLRDIVGPRPRLDHIYLDIIRKGLSPIGATLHGGATPFDPAQYYLFRDGRMRAGLVVVAYNLSDVQPGDGGFACIPGSHKSNYPLPESWKDMSRKLHPEVECVPGPAGSAIIFTEALSHGPLPWRGARERRTVFFKYSPHCMSWSANYFDSAAYPDLSEAEREILEPPKARPRARKKRS